MSNISKLHYHVIFETRRAFCYVDQVKFSHGGAIEKEVQLFLLSEISIHLSYATFFVKILTHCKKVLNHAVILPLHQGYCFTYLYGCVKFLS